jgi:flagella basal body P-ring formation protein FlgA
MTKHAALVKSGDRVLLVFEDPPVRMQLQVICLDRGALGKQVRAIDPSTRRIFHAEVTGAGTLKARL